MKNSPIPRMVLVYFLYTALIFTWWTVIDADYTNLVGSDVVFTSLILPIAAGTLLIIGAISVLGWWQPVMKEEKRNAPRWVAVPIILLMATFMGVNALVTDWSAIGVGHLAMLAAAALLVGFNEEALCRGILVTGFRQVAFSEKKVWFLSSVMFGLMHLPNAFFGTGLSGGLTQAINTFFAATAFYILRRSSGSLLVPILFHAGWDFSLFAQQASGAPPATMGAILLNFAVSLTAICLVYFVVRNKSAGATSPA